MCCGACGWSVVNVISPRLLIETGITPRQCKYLPKKPAKKVDIAHEFWYNVHIVRSNMYYIVSQSADNNYVSIPYNTVEAAEIAFRTDPAVDQTVCVILSAQQFIDSLVIERDGFKTSLRSAS